LSESSEENKEAQMPLSINTNIASLTAQRAMINSNAGLETAFERLSTGKRVNSSSDDAAGLAIGKDLESRVRGLNQAVRNVNDGISMVQIAEGALDEVTTILQRMRDLAVQAANGSLGSAERGYLDTEHKKLAESLNSVVGQAKFGSTQLIDTSDTPVTLQTGADASDTLSITFDKMSDAILGLTEADVDLTGVTADAENFDFLVTDAVANAQNQMTFTIDGSTYVLDTTSADTSQAVSQAINNDAALSAVVTATYTGTASITLTHVNKGEKQGANSLSLDTTNATLAAVNPDDGVADASGAIVMIDAALATVASDRATLGATQAQLESTVRNLANVAENTAAAQGRIMDTDYAAETANLTKAQILQQAATSILAQANAQPQGVLSLLQ
jgi:flagellin